MDSEYKSLLENKTWILVPRPKNKKVLSNRWVFKTKFNQKGEVNKFKARLVVRGHTQREGVDYEETFAPVSRCETIRTLLAAYVNENMHVHQMDVVSAYTQGELSDEIYMEQPEMYLQKNEESKVCKLVKPLYGLKQSGREWYKTFDKYVTNNGGKRNMADPCLYVFNEGDDRVIMLIYVDDLILASKRVEKLESIKSKLKSAFKMVDLGPIHDILGIYVERQGLTGSIYISQKKYIEDLIAKFNMEDAKTVSTPMETNTRITKESSPRSEDERAEMKNRPYRELVDGLIYLANATRPDIAFAASTLNRFCTDPGELHWALAKRVLRYLKGTSHYSIKYIKSQNALTAYTDSDWAGDVDDRKSCTGNVIMLANGPVSWKSKKQASVVLSTMEAEYAALAEISREIIYVKRLLTYMGFEKFVKNPINVYCDNQSAIELSKNAVFHKRSKHIDISFHITRELVEKKMITIHYLRTESMIADILTKSLSKDKHFKCISVLQID